jgi:hypothetical protein
MCSTPHVGDTGRTPKQEEFVVVFRLLTLLYFTCSTQQGPINTIQTGNLYLCNYMCPDHCFLLLLLAGTVPASYANLKSLTDLYLYNNPGLTGCVPASLGTQLQVSPGFSVDDFVLDATGLKGFC